MLLSLTERLELYCPYAPSVSNICFEKSRLLNGCPEGNDYFYIEKCGGDVCLVINNYTDELDGTIITIYCTSIMNNVCSNESIDIIIYIIEFLTKGNIEGCFVFVM